jgi:hypothetical protein
MTGRREYDSDTPFKAFIIALIVFTMVFALAGKGLAYVEVHGQALPFSGNTNAKEGFIINVTTNNLYFSNVTLGAGNPTIAYIADVNGNVIESAPYVGGFAKFSGTTILTAGSTYQVLNDNAGSMYTHYAGNSGSFPHFGTYINWSAGITGPNIDTNGYDIASIGVDPIPVIPKQNISTDMPNSTSMGNFFNATFTVNYPLNSTNESAILLYNGTVVQQLSNSSTNPNITYVYLVSLPLYSANTSSSWTFNTTYFDNSSKMSWMNLSRNATQSINLVNVTTSMNVLGVVGSQQTLSASIKKPNNAVINSFSISYRNQSTNAVLTSDNGFVATYTGTFMIPLNNTDVVGVANLSWSGIDNLMNTYNYGLLQTQTIQTYALDNCSAFSTKAVNITIYDSITKEVLSGNISAFIRTYSADKSSFMDFNMSFIGNTTYGICINPTALNTTYSAQFLYGSPGYTIRTYYYNNRTISSNQDTLPLYLDSAAQSVPFQVQDQDAQPVPNAYFYLMLYNFQTNQYITDEVILTDSQGNGVMHPELLSQYYKVIIVVNGKSYLDTSPFKVVNTDKETFQIQLQKSFLTTLSTVQSVACNVSFSNSTRLVTFSWNDQSGTTVSACLNTVGTYQGASTQYNLSCATSSAGQTFITLPASNQKTNYAAYGSIALSDGSVYSCGAGIIVTDSIDETNGYPGSLFLVLIIIMVMALATIDHPVISVMAVGVGLTLSKIIGIFGMSWNIIIPMWIMIGVIMYRLNQK